MKEDFVKEGMWSIDPEMSSSVYGRLIYDKINGIRLELRGEIDGFNRANHTIYGQLFHNSINVTLFGCKYVNQTDYHSPDIIAENCFIGAIFIDIKSIKIIQANVQYYGLGDYIKETGITISDFESKKVKFEYNRPKEKQIKTHNFDLHIDIGCNSSFKADWKKSGNKKFEFDEIITVKFKYHNVVSVNIISQDIRYFAFLIELLNNSIVFPEKIEFIIPDGTKIEYYYKNPYLREKFLSTNEQYIDYAKIDLDEVVNNWFQRIESFKTFGNYKTISDLYHNLFDENRFQDSFVALETFYREFRNASKKIYNKQKFLKLHQEIPETIQNSITDKLNKYCDILVDSRNAFTHNDRKEKIIFKGPYIVKGTRNNEVLIKYLLLKELNLDQLINHKSVDYDIETVIIKNALEYDQIIKNQLN